MKLPQWSRRPWLLAGVTLAVALVPVWLTWLNYRTESVRKDEQLFQSTADLVAEKVLLKAVRHVNALNIVRNFFRNNPEARPDLPATFHASLPHLTAHALVTDEDGHMKVRWTSPNSNRFAQEGQDLAITPKIESSFLDSIKAGAPRATGVRWDDSHMLIIQPVQRPQNFPNTPNYLIGWVDMVGLCHDQTEQLVRDKIITVDPWRNETPLPADARLYDQKESDVLWTLVVSRGPRFHAEYGQVAPHYVLFGGCLSALLLSILVAFATRANQLHAALSSEREIGRMRSQFVSSVSHEFRTPLGVILSGADLLEAHAGQLTPERRADVFAQIKDSTHRMNDMVEQVLLLGHIESGTLKVNRQSVDMTALCQSIADEVDVATEQRCKLEVDVAPHSASPIVFDLDASLLRSILGNLLGNAVKYSPPGADVVLAVQVFDGVARFEVIDHGIGIPVADQPRLFEPFHRGSNVGEITGTGLGLAIVERCVKLQGGALGIHSAEGEGTTIVVTIPRP